MVNLSTRKVVLSLVLAAMAFLLVGSLSSRMDYRTRSQLELKRPSFLSGVEVARANFDIGAKLDDEAGMSAYFSTTGPIDLSLVHNALRTVEIETADYIIGSVDTPNYPEVYDAHIYVHKDGWFLAYYSRADSPSKIIDTRGKTIQSTLLESALSVVAGAAGAPFSSATHYDFRYPNATHMLFVAEDYPDGNCFEITLPSNFGYFDRGWAIFDPGSTIFSIDGTNLPSTYSNGTYDIFYGSISASELLPDTIHAVCIGNENTAYGVVIILYREQ